MCIFATQDDEDMRSYSIHNALIFTPPRPAKSVAGRAIPLFLSVLTPPAAGMAAGDTISLFFPGRNLPVAGLAAGEGCFFAAL